MFSFLPLQCTKHKTWKDIAAQLGIGASSSGAYTLKKHYAKNLLPFECQFDRGGMDPAPLMAQVEGPGKKKGPAKAAAATTPQQPPPAPSPGEKEQNSNDFATVFERFCPFPLQQDLRTRETRPVTAAPTRTLRTPTAPPRHRPAEPPAPPATLLLSPVPRPVRPAARRPRAPPRTTTTRPTPLPPEEDRQETPGRLTQVGIRSSKSILLR